jgi:hypothetical protein
MVNSGGKSPVGTFETCRPTVKCLLVGLDRKSSVRVTAMLLTQLGHGGLFQLATNVL